MGDLKQMKPEWLRGISLEGYGVSLAVGIGIPIPVLNEDVLKYAAVKDEDIYAQIVDYSNDYPNAISNSLGEVNYKQLKSGSILFRGKETPTVSLSSYAKARAIAEELKDSIMKGRFLLTEPVALLPSADSGAGYKALKERPVPGL
jgi:uncharacterized protein (DUF39 family)